MIPLLVRNIKDIWNEYDVYIYKATRLYIETGQHKHLIAKSTENSMDIFLLFKT